MDTFRSFLRSEQRPVRNLSPQDVLAAAKSTAEGVGGGIRGITDGRNTWWARSAWWTHHEMAKAAGMEQMPSRSESFDLDYLAGEDRYLFLRPQTPLHPLLAAVADLADRHNRARRRKTR